MLVSAKLVLIKFLYEIKLAALFSFRYFRILDVGHRLTATLLKLAAGS